jgi:hypothetical protein
MCRGDYDFRSWTFRVQALKPRYYVGEFYTPVAAGGLF